MLDAFRTVLICLVVANAAEAKLFFMASSPSSLDGYVDGYWEYEGKWQNDLPLVIDQISQSCGLSGSYVMMSDVDGSNLNQQARYSLCEASKLTVPWQQAQMSQFNPDSPGTVLTILNSVRFLWHLFWHFKIG